MKVYLLYKTLEKNADTIGALEKPTAAIDTTWFYSIYAAAMHVVGYSPVDNHAHNLRRSLNKIVLDN